MPENLKIILCEDDEDIAFLIKLRILKAFPNTEVFITTNKEDTIKLLYDYNFDIDIVLLDYMLSNTTGIEILEEVKKISDIPVIIITGQGSEELAVTAMKKGASDYIVKRGRFFNQIPDVIDRVLRSKSKYELSKIFIAFYRFGESGTEPIYVSKLPKEFEGQQETILLSLGVLLFTLFGMGELEQLDSGSIIAGPVRIPKMHGYGATSFLFVVKDKNQKDPRFSGHDFCIVALGYPNEYSDISYKMDRVKRILENFFEGINDISEVKDHVGKIEKQILNIIKKF